MERLTERYIPNDEKNGISGIKIFESENKIPIVKVLNGEYLYPAIEKLATYEDLEEQGLLVRLPCKVGDDVYIIPSPSVYGLNIINGYEMLNKIYHQHIGTIVITTGHWYVTSREEYGVYNEKVLNDIAFGTTWFLTREEAEKKLEEMKNE